MLLAERMQEIAKVYDGELPLPAGPAPGALNEFHVDAYMEHVDEVIRSPFAVVPMGSICSIPNVGNAVKFADPNTQELALDYYHDPTTGETTNSIGLRQFGIKAALEILPALSRRVHDANKLLKVSVSTIGDEDPAKVLPELVERVFEAVGETQVAVEANFGCPNKVELSGVRHPILGRDVEATGLATEAILRVIGTKKMFGSKLSYYDVLYREEAELLEDICEVISLPGVDFASIANAEVGCQPRYSDGSYVLDKIPNHAGGGSGPARRESGYQQLVIARRVLPSVIDVVSTNGVYDGQEIRRRELGGAVFSELVSRLWQERQQSSVNYGTVGHMLYQEYIAARNAESEASDS